VVIPVRVAMMAIHKSPVPTHS